MKLELYFKEGCGFCDSVKTTMVNVGCTDKIEMKNIETDPNFKKELEGLVEECKVPCLCIDGKPMQESQEINKFLVQNFL